MGGDIPVIGGAIYPKIGDCISVLASCVQKTPGIIETKNLKIKKDKNMEHITPTRFLELLEQSENDYIELWDKGRGDWKRFTHIIKYNGLYFVFYNQNYNLKIELLYEHKPKTLYDELFKRNTQLNGCSHYYIPTELIDRYKTQLESIIIED